MKKSLVWLRRVLRLNDNLIIDQALKNSEKISVCFVFDSKILSFFPNPNDKRLSFIVDHLEIIDKQLKKNGGSLNILFGDPIEEVTKFAKQGNYSEIYADEDYEPSSIERDSNISEALRSSGIKLKTVLDHLLIKPDEILKEDGLPFKVFTPYMKKFRSKLFEKNIEEVTYNLNGKLVQNDSNFDKNLILNKAGYNYFSNSLWNPESAEDKFSIFLNSKLNNYADRRNMLSQDGTSQFSPYLRFGSLSIRKLFKKFLESESNPSFINELIWREFYAYIMFHYPYSMNSEFQTKYQGKIPWNDNHEQFKAFCEGKTGFPVVDAAIRQLLTTGWMHNRARMIVASFFTKNLFMDWKLGEKFFAEYLMDYDLASNVGGWQWTASTGTDAQPYFRVFNPMSQSKNFDPDGLYIKKFVPELNAVNINDIHDGCLIRNKYKFVDYPNPIVDYKSSRERAILIFKNIE